MLICELEKLPAMTIPFSGFICLCESISDVDPDRVFQEKIKLELGESVFRMIYSDECKVIEKNGITVILCGNLFYGIHPDSIPELYIKYGDETGRYLSGFYAILIFDKLKEKAVIISDRMSSKPLYFTKWAGSWMVSTSFLQLTRYLPGEPVLDFSGVAWYISNGVIHNSHTLFMEVKRLERATLYCGNVHSFTAHEYWKYHFLDVQEHRDERTMINKMKEVLSTAVNDCLPRDESVYLSLSAGYDSSGILAVLKNTLNIKDVKTFSYGLSEDEPLSDSLLARSLSELVGYDHFSQTSYNYDFKNALELNALWGDGISYFCDEVYAWQQLGFMFNGSRPTCLFGDTIFSYFNHLELSDEADALEANLIRDAGHISWLNQYIPSDDFNSLAVELDRGCQILIEKAKDATNDLQSVVNYLRVEGRARNVLIPWRQNFCSKAFMPMNPMYHDDCLEFQKNNPQDFRKGKTLFINTVNELAPEFYQSARARFMGYVPDWKSEISRNYKMIVEEYLKNKGSYQLEAIISPEAIIRIIENEILHPKDPVKRPFNITVFSKFLFYRNLPGKTSPVRKILSPEKFILRYLVLKRTLEIIREIREMKSSPEFDH